MKTIPQSEFVAEATKRFGPKARNWQFVCPACGTLQTPQQFLDAGVSEDKVRTVMGFSCIGRYTGQGDAGIAAKSKGLPWDRGCNWTLGGLLRIHTLALILDDGSHSPIFELAPPANAAPCPAESQSHAESQARHSGECAPETPA